MRVLNTKLIGIGINQQPHLLARIPDVNNNRQPISILAQFTELPTNLSIRQLWQIIAQSHSILI